MLKLDGGRPTSWYVIFQQNRTLFDYLYLLFFSFQINDVINCKDVIDFFADVKKVDEFRLLKRKWTALKEIGHVLSIPFKATVALQEQALTLSDVFGICLKMKLHLQACSAKKNYKSNLVKHLLSCLEQRKDTIFNNPFMSSALFLDPRFRNQIANDEERMSEAKTTLIKLWQRLKVLSDPVSTESITNTTNASKGSDISFEYDENSELDTYLAGVSQSEPNESNIPTQSGEDIVFLLDSFNPPNVSSKTNIYMNRIFDYWEEIKVENEELYKLAMVVYGIPPTEVQIERDFSALNFVFSNRRCMIQEERLEDIMVIHLNPDLFYEVKEEELIALKSRHFEWILLKFPNYKKIIVFISSE